MATPYSFSCFPREPPKHPVINENPTAGAVIANFGAADVGRILGTTAIGAVWGFVWGAPLRPSNKGELRRRRFFPGVLWGRQSEARAVLSRVRCGCEQRSATHASARTPRRQARAPRPLRTGGTRNHSDEIVGVT